MKKILLLLIVTGIVSGCRMAKAPATLPEEEGNKIVKEYPVIPLVLPDKYASRDMEYSGMAWYKNYLVLLPQYPDKLAPEGYDGGLVYITKENISAAIDSSGHKVKAAGIIGIRAPWLGKYTGTGSGFEGIEFSGNKIFFLAELTGTETEGLLFGGTINDSLTVTLNEKPAAPVFTQAGIHNLADEAVTYINGKIVTFHEANGQNINPDPIANLYDTTLQPLGGASFPNIEYRVTGATSAVNNKFWIINYLYPGDYSTLDPGPDSLVLQYGVGEKHYDSPVVERVIEIEMKGDGFVFSGTPPLQLELADNEKGRNWEGIARLDEKGLLLVTDMYPETIFAFVPFDKENKEK